jgi:hypothetical protein
MLNASEMTESLKIYLENPSEDAGYAYFRFSDVAFCRDRRRPRFGCLLGWNLHSRLRVPHRYGSDAVDSSLEERWLTISSYDWNITGAKFHDD